MAMMMLRPTDADAAADEPIVLKALDSVSEPATPALPDWLTGDPELARGLERLARAMAAYPGPKQLMYNLLDHQAGFIENTTATWNDPRPAPRPAPEPEPEPERARATILKDERVAVIRFGKLDRNARRRAQRRIAKQPRGREHPIIRLRLGRYGDEKPYDFLDVAMPELHHSRDDSAIGWATRVYDRMEKLIRPEGSPDPFGTVLCSHHGRREAGAKTVMAAYPDGRNAVYLYEAMA